MISLDVLIVEINKKFVSGELETCVGPNLDQSRPKSSVQGKRALSSPHFSYNIRDAAIDLEIKSLLIWASIVKEDFQHTFGSPWMTSLVLMVSNGKDTAVATHPAPSPAVKWTPVLMFANSGKEARAFLVITSNKPNWKNPKVIERACAARWPFQSAVHPSFCTMCLKPWNTPL